LRDDRVIAADAGIRRDIGHSRHCAEPEAMGTMRDLGMGACEGVNVDHHRGPHDVELHEVEQGRAAREIMCARTIGVDSGAEIVRLLKGERTHQPLLLD
jgi:hypothetical protein